MKHLHLTTFCIIAITWTIQVHAQGYGLLTSGGSDYDRTNYYNNNRGSFGGSGSNSAYGNNNRGGYQGLSGNFNRRPNRPNSYNVNGDRGLNDQPGYLHSYYGGSERGDRFGDDDYQDVFSDEFRFRPSNFYNRNSPAYNLRNRQVKSTKYLDELS